MLRRLLMISAACAIGFGGKQDRIDRAVAYAVAQRVDYKVRLTPKRPPPLSVKP
jgi:hypothetical protein